jgi:hypothetical protein
MENEQQRAVEAEKDPGSIRDKWGGALFAINIIGAAMYVIAASRGGWVTPQVRELHAVTAEPFIWASDVAPTLATFLLLNLAWGLVCFLKPTGKLRKMWWLMTIPAWIIAMAIDFSHH